MSKRNRKIRQGLAKGLVSCFVLLVFLAPLLISAKMLLAVVAKRDPRKVQPAAVFQVRTADKTKTPLEPLKQPVISVTFDDGWASVYYNGFTELQLNGLHTTQYIITDTFDNYDYMSLAQLHSLQKAGHEIASHTVTHPDLTLLNGQQLTHELADSRRRLEKEFGPVKDFTSPYGAYNQYTLKQIGMYYRSQKNAEGFTQGDEAQQVNTVANFNPLNFVSYSVRNTTTLDDIKRLIKAAQDQNGWLVLTYHQIDTTNETYSVSPEHFDQQIEYIRDADIRSATVGQVMEALYPNWRATK